MKYKTLTPDVLLGALTRKKPSFKIEMQAEVTPDQSASMYVVMHIDGEEYLVDTLRELRVLVAIIEDMVTQVEMGSKQGSVVQQIVRKDLTTGEEVVISEKTIGDDEEEEDEAGEDPKKLS